MRCSHLFRFTDSVSPFNEAPYCRCEELARQPLACQPLFLLWPGALTDPACNRANDILGAYFLPTVAVLSKSHFIPSDTTALTLPSSVSISCLVIGRSPWPHNNTPRKTSTTTTLLSSSSEVAPHASQDGWSGDRSCPFSTACSLA